MKLYPPNALLAVLLAAGAAAPCGAAEAPAAPARSYAIGAAPLADVLNRFAAEAGVVLVFDAGLLRGVPSPGLQGKYAVQAGFQALLAGTRYEAVLGGAGGYILRERRPAPAQRAGAVPAAPALLHEVIVKESRLPTVERLDRQMIANLPAINGDLTSQLKLNPNIQYAEASLSSLTGGEIAPAEISIHGAKPYQNEILLDGVSIANDIDPGNKIVATSPEFIPGSAQSLAVDSSILCDVEVQDSNVSAEYGRFTGGVVSAKICAARKRYGGSVSVGYTSSGWSTLFIDPAQQLEFEQSSSADHQPRFRKWTYKSTVEARPDPDWGVLASVVRKTSEIPLKRFSTSNSATTESREVTQERVQDTLVVKADHSPAGGRHKAEITLVYAPSDNSYFIEDYRDSDYTIRTGGLSLSGRLESRYAPLKLTQQMSYTRNEQSRRSDANYYRNWRWSSEKSWGDPGGATNPASGEGALGDVDQQSRTLEYKLRAGFNPVASGEASHRFAAGAEVRRLQAEYARLKDQYYYLTVASLPASGAIARCIAANGSVDTEACSAAPTLRQGLGQYFRNLYVYHAGRFGLDSSSWAAYAEDDASWRNLTLRAGLRADHDTLAGKTNLAPRLRLGWQWRDTVLADLGANRYYGRNLLAYALQDQINTLKTTQTRLNTLTWSTPLASKPLNRLQDMNSPHDDELSAGLAYEGDLLAGPVSLRFTRRDGKDQIVKLLKTGQADCNASQCYIYSNNGGSTARDVTLSWSNARAFKLAGVGTRMWVAFNKSDVKANYASYADTYGSSLLNDELIRYDGKIIRYSDKPADNYNRPWTLRVGAISTAPAHALTVSHVLRLRAGYRQIVQNGTYVYEGASIVNYEQTELPRSAAVDTVVHWNPRVYRDQRLDLKLTIENLTNKRNRIAVGDSYATYERGRSFALEVGYGF